MQIEVAVATPVSATFTYEAEELVTKGVRVLVPFGRRQMVGVSLGPVADPKATDFAVKKVVRVLDNQPVYSETMLRLAHWLSAYYLYPLGEVLRAMLPAGTAKVKREAVALTEAGRAHKDSCPEGHLAHLFKKRAQLTLATLKKNAKELPGAIGNEVAEWLDNGLIRIETCASYKVREVEGELGLIGPAGTAAPEKPILNLSQQAVYQEIVQRGLACDVKRPFLLFGVTGSGKTEVYLHVIEEHLKLSEGTGQTLVMVPEISLTPQMTRVFAQRFPGQVAVVHSAMADKDRWNQLELIRSGQRSILIGPRSSVFGPFKQLGLILVDEEHDSSYKQGSGLPYHGRDVAIVRGQMEGATVVLGSATPSLESYANALSGKYTLLKLAERATGKPLPLVEVIKEKPSFSQGEFIRPQTWKEAPEDQVAEIPIAQSIVDALRDNAEAGGQAMVLVNRRGYAYYLFSLTEKKAVQCPHCSISLTLHKRSTILRCHYCDYRTQMETLLRDRQEESFVAVGFGSEKAESYLKSVLPGLRIQRLDSDILTNRDQLEAILTNFKDRQLDVLVGTQILAKGHDFPDVTLIAILEVDQQLNLPDFRSGERTFQLVVQAGGRAGRAERAGKVLIQCLKDDNPIISLALNHDYEGFAERELSFRRNCGYPPFTHLVLADISSGDQARLADVCRQMDLWFDEHQPKNFADVRILGPTLPAISMVRGRHRRTVLFTARERSSLHRCVQAFQRQFEKLPSSVRMRLDVDPQSLI